MITALEAKQKVFRKRSYYEIVANRINEAASNGDLMCAVRMEDLPITTMGKLYEIESFLNEFGYQTMIVDKNTLIIRWVPSWQLHANYVGDDKCEEE